MYADTVTTAQKRIDQIEYAIEIIQAKLEQDKQDILKLDWADVGDLGRIAEVLSNAVEFLGG